MRNIIILFSVLLSQFHISSFSQSHTGIVRGTVTDSLTGLPVENFAVFIPFTSIGTTTNSDGEFVLDKAPVGNCKLMFRHVAYQAGSLLITVVENRPVVLNLSASLNNFDIGEIVKNGRVADWETSLMIFKKHFLGDPSGRVCSIRNPRDLFFYYDGDVLMAHARKPLMIYNRYLGYEITYYLDYFKFFTLEIPDNKQARDKEREGLSALERLRAGWTEPVNTASVRYFQAFSGSAIYEDMAVEHRIRGINWELNREAEFSGSLKHFLIGLYRDTLAGSRYELRKAWSKSDWLRMNLANQSDRSQTDQQSKPDSISIWDYIHDRPANLYYRATEKYHISGEQIQAGPQPGDKTLFLDGPLLLFYDTENTDDLRDDRIAEILIQGGRMTFDSYGNYTAPEGSRIWVYHDPGIKLKVLLPNDYLSNH